MNRTKNSNMRELSDGEVVSSDEEVKRERRRGDRHRRDRHSNRSGKVKNYKKYRSDRARPKNDPKIEEEIELDEDEILNKRRLARLEIMKKYADPPQATNIVAPPITITNTQVSIPAEKEPPSKSQPSEIIEISDMFDLDYLRSGSRKVEVDGFVAGAEQKVDAEGYYQVQIGELLNERYLAFGVTGKGVFSSVIRVRDKQRDDAEFAVKVIRQIDVIQKQSAKEIEILELLNGQDPSDKYHIVRYFGNFQHQNQLCIVLESLSMNLRELLKKFGNKVGLNINAVKLYAKQMFLALKFLKKHNVIHCDIKLDNIMVNNANTSIKLVDFGSAMISVKDTVANVTYLQSRFYRAPEVILGFAPTPAIDLWSVGCTIYEIYTGTVCFPGNSNNHMLKLFMDLKGKFSHKMLRKSNAGEHFDENFNFIYKEYGEGAGGPKVSLLNPVHNKSKSVLLSGENEELRNLLDRIFCLNPEKRIALNDCISFF